MISKKPNKLKTGLTFVHPLIGNSVMRYFGVPRRPSVSYSIFLPLTRVPWNCTRCGFQSTRAYSSRNGKPLTSVYELKGLIDSHQSPVILDCTWFMPNVPRDALSEFQKGRIPGARFFNLDEVIDKTSPYPHMLPSPEAFAQAAGNKSRETVLIPRVTWNNSSGIYDFLYLSHHRTMCAVMIVMESSRPHVFGGRSTSSGIAL